MVSGGDCVLRLAARIPSLHRSGLERQGGIAGKSPLPIADHRSAFFAPGVTGVIGATGVSGRLRLKYGPTPRPGPSANLRHLLHQPRDE
jgi:hypothetical protein